MSKFVDKVENRGEVFEIQDARIPLPAEGDAGKVVKVSDALGFEFGEAGSEEMWPYVESVDMDTTIQDLVTALNITVPSGRYSTVKEIFYVKQLSGSSIVPTNFPILLILATNFEQELATIKVKALMMDNSAWNFGVYEYSSLNSKFLQPETNNKYIEVPYDYSVFQQQKTFDLKLTNGVMNWQEAASGGTQLYKHAIKITDAPHQNIIYINVISNTANQYQYAFEGGMPRLVATDATYITGATDNIIIDANGMGGSISRVYTFSTATLSFTLSTEIDATFAELPIEDTVTPL